MRTAVVTGGGTGIGRAIALELVEHGLDVTITGRRAEVLAAVPKVRPVAFDATDPGAVGDSMTEQRLTTLIGQTKNGRAGTPQDVAALVAFLASERAGHITGQVLAVNGGAHLGR